MQTRARKICAVLLASVISVGAGGAHAASHVLGDHPDGDKRCANEPAGSSCRDCGHRVDDIPEYFTMALGNAIPTWDGGVTATIPVTMNVSHAAIAGTIPLTVGVAVNVFYVLTSVASDGNGGFTATGDQGSVWNAVGQYDFVGKQNNAGFPSVFAFDGHRVPDTTSPTSEAGSWTREAAP